MAIGEGSFAVSVVLVRVAICGEADCHVAKYEWQGG